MHRQFVCRYDTHTAQEPGSLFWCQVVMSLQFTHVWSFSCICRLRNLRADCFIVDLHCITITWQQIFKGLLQVTIIGILPHVTVERDILAGNASRQQLLIAVRHVSFILCEKSMSESAVMLAQV